MKIVPSPMTVLDYCEALERGEVVVNRDYQRSGKVWPDVARSYLIETVLMGYPVPKLWLHQIVDHKSKKAIKEVVDGQQRTAALYDFYRGHLRLASNLELEGASGKTYDELDDELQGEFLNYPLSFDLFVNTTSEEVREVFRRINSYTIPLNPEEKRHAVWQGHFKWFINRLSRTYAEALLHMGLFTENQLVRMQDAKLLTEVVSALLDGITTTRATTLDALYRSRDKNFPEERECDQRLTRALDELVSWSAIHRTALMKPYAAYSLILAMIHVRSLVPQLQEAYGVTRNRHLDAAVAQRNLLILADALENEEGATEFAEFVEASSSKTNVAEQRKRRFQWFCRAIRDEL